MTNRLTGDITAANALLRVLIVDDDQAMRSSVRRVLRLDGYQVTTAGSCAEMLGLGNLDGFFAILLDRKLPDGDSSKLIAQVRERAPNTAILIITGHADMDSTLVAFRQGVDDYLIKPFEPDTLRSRLGSLAELYRMKLELRESESRMRFMVENLPAGAVYVDRETLLINRAVEAMTGYAGSEIGSVEAWFSVLCCDKSDECRKKYQLVKEAGFPDACVLPITRRDGVPRELELAGYRYDHHEVWLVTDITELHNAQKKLVQSERLAAIGQMVTGLAHESRNALQRARGCLDLLELDLEGQSEQLDLTARIRRSLGDLQRNYEEVRDYAAPINLRLSDWQLVTLLQHAFEDLQCEFGGHDLRIEAQDGLPPIRADEHRLKQVFRNVFENSIAASGCKAEITVSIDRQRCENGAHQTVTIQDRGEGMSPETLARLFEPFYTTKQSGTGLGMAICQRVIDAHGGTLRATSKPGAGTTIHISLPEQTKP